MEVMSDSSDMASSAKQCFECPRCKNNYSTAYSMYRHMRKVHNCNINRGVTLYCPIENCNESYDRYNALDTHLTHVHYADIRKETFQFSDLSDFEGWLRDITSSSNTKYIKRSCNNSYRYYRCHRSGLPKTSTEKLNNMKSSVKIGRHCPSRIIAKIKDRNVQVEFVPTHIGHDCEISKIPLSQKKRLDIACRLTASSNNSINNNLSTIANCHHHFDESVQGSQILQSQQHHLHISHSTQQTSQAIDPHQANSITSVDRLTERQAATPTILQAGNPIMVTLDTVKDNQISIAMDQSSSVLEQTQIEIHPNNKISDTTSMVLKPSLRELTCRFDELLGSIKSDKHASIVKAQLEVCFALIRD